MSVPSYPGGGTFVSAWGVWRFLPRGPYAGAIGGVLTVTLVYLFSTALVIVAPAWPRSDGLRFTIQEQLVGSVGGGILVGITSSNEAAEADPSSTAITEWLPRTELLVRLHRSVRR